MSVSNSFISVETVMPGAHLRGGPIIISDHIQVPTIPKSKDTAKIIIEFHLFPSTIKILNFSVWKNIWSDFQGKCPFLIRSFPGYFVVGIISGGGHLLTYSYPLSQTRPFRKTSSFFVKITLLILILALKTCRDLSLRVFTMACSFIIFLRLDLWDSILVSLKLCYEHT